LPKLGRKDFCSRDPARVQSGNIFPKGVALPPVKLFSARLWSQRSACNFERWLKEILVLGRVRSTGWKEANTDTEYIALITNKAPTAPTRECHDRRNHHDHHEH
jgi:hypothetical protein